MQDSARLRALIERGVVSSSVLADRASVTMYSSSHLPAVAVTVLPRQQPRGRGTRRGSGKGARGRGTQSTSSGHGLLGGDSGRGSRGSGKGTASLGRGSQGTSSGAQGGFGSQGTNMGQTFTLLAPEDFPSQGSRGGRGSGKNGRGAGKGAGSNSNSGKGLGGSSSGAGTLGTDSSVARSTHTDNSHGNGRVLFRDAARLEGKLVPPWGHLLGCAPFLGAALLEGAAQAFA